MTAVTMRGLGVRRRGRVVLQGVDLAIEPGQVVGLIGPNGAGKSTLLAALAGVLAHTGAVEVSGAPVAGMGRRARARQLAYLPQERQVAWALGVEAVVGLGRLPHAPDPAADAAAIDRAIGQMDLAAFRGRPVTELSGGELARVLIARALAQDTPVLLADEPVAALDPAHQIGLMVTFRDLARAGRTVILALHDLALCARWCDRVVLLASGRLVADGAPQTILDAKRLADVYGIQAYRAHHDGGWIITPTGLAAPEPPVP